MKLREGTQPEQLQAEYYKETATQYDSMHVRDDDEHHRALTLIATVAKANGLTTVLDVGTGTGRALEYLKGRGFYGTGVEPIPELRAIAQSKVGDTILIVQAAGEQLPFEHDTFDVVLECGVLHHVPNPEVVVAEMIRVAKYMVCLSDSNRFGQGSWLARTIKLLLYRTNLWRLARLIQTRGKMYTVSDGDGVAYSYSVYDSYEQIAAWADRVWLIPTADSKHNSWFTPLLTSGTVLLIGTRDKP